MHHPQVMQNFLHVLQNGGLEHEFRDGTLHVIDNFLLTKSTLDRIPDGVVFHQDVELNSMALAELPASLDVRGGLFLYDVLIDRLPRTLSVGGDVMIEQTRVTELPLGFTVQASLTLGGPVAIVLPEGLRVRGSLHLRTATILRLPREMHIESFIEPSPHMLDLVAFMQGQAGEVMLAFPESAHEVLALHGRLAAFPDLVRIVLSLQPGDSIHLAHGTHGGVSTEFSWDRENP